MTSQWDMGHDLDKFTASFKIFHVKNHIGNSNKKFETYDSDVIAGSL
jgi:hypothetical protein